MGDTSELEHMNKKKFYDAVRRDIILTPQNVLGMDKVLDYLEMTENNLNQAAYIIATAWWETAQTMMPVKEAYWLSEDWRKKNLRYFPYYGRGYVQLTWEANYKKASDYFGIDFVKQPDRVMDVEYALAILVVGMNEGWFTGKELDDYIDEDDENDSEELREYKAARRIVNGVDKAEQVSRLALIFEKGLKASDYAFRATQKPTEPIVDLPAVVVPKTPKPSARGSNWFVELVKLLVNLFIARK